MLPPSTASSNSEVSLMRQHGFSGFQLINPIREESSHIDNGKVNCDDMQDVHSDIKI